MKCNSSTAAPPVADGKFSPTGASASGASQVPDLIVMLTWNSILLSGGVRVVCARTSGNQQWRKQSQTDSLAFEGKDKGSLRERGSKIWVACLPGGNWCESLQMADYYYVFSVGTLLFLISMCSLCSAIPLLFKNQLA